MTRENLKYQPPPEPEVPATDSTENTPEAPVHEVKPVRPLRKGRKAVQNFLGGDYLTRSWVTNNIFFFLYLSLLAMIYIGNTYSTERKYKEIERTKTELKELRYHYITIKSVLMFEGRQSEISKRASALQLKESGQPPYKIFYSSNQVRSDGSK